MYGRVPVLPVELRRRKSGFLTAVMIAGDTVGKNILANRHFGTVKRARAAVQVYMDGKFGQSVQVEWRGEDA